MSPAWFIDNDCWEANEVTHWMPLPAPPGKDNNVPTKEQNEPLTLDELLTMNGEPVYVVFRPDGSGEKSQSWALVNVDEKYGEVYLVDSIPGASCYYDEIWANLEGIYRDDLEAENEKLRAELEQVKRALSMMWFAYVNVLSEMEKGCVFGDTPEQA